MRSRQPEWQLRVPKPSGKGHFYERFPSFTAANRRAIEVEHARNAGDVPTNANMRFGELLDEWLAARTVNLRKSTKVDYEAVANRLRPHWHTRKIRSLTAKDVEVLRDDTLAEVRATAIAKAERQLAGNADLATQATELRSAAERSGVRSGARVVLGARTILKFAIERGYLARNVATGVKLPKADAGDSEADVVEADILTPAEIARFVTEVPEKHRCAVKLLFRAGLRFAELCGSQWGDVEFATGRILVRHQRCRFSGKLIPLKTAASRRWIDLDAEMVRELKELPSRFAGGDVFAIERSNFRSRVWHPALRRAGLRRIRIHDARHTHASLLIAAGADVADVSRRLGHANPAITLKVYTHAFSRRATAPLGERLAAFMRAETNGCEMVAMEQRDKPARA